MYALSNGKVTPHGAGLAIGMITDIFQSSHDEESIQGIITTWLTTPDSPNFHRTMALAQASHELEKDSGARPLLIRWFRTDHGTSFLSFVNIYRPTELSEALELIKTCLISGVLSDDDKTNAFGLFIDIYYSVDEYQSSSMGVEITEWLASPDSPELHLVAAFVTAYSWFSDGSKSSRFVNRATYTELMILWCKSPQGA